MTDCSTITCAYCSVRSEKSNSAVNRARRDGAPLYCNRACAGKARRKNISKEERKERKRQYDMEYRRKNRAMLKVKKAAYFQRTYDPVAAAKHRQTRMPYHLEYCRRPEYRAWKKQYDREYRARKIYGDYWECFLLTQDIREEALTQMTDYEIRHAKGGIAKTQNRRRDYERTHSKSVEVGPMGHTAGR